MDNARKMVLVTPEQFENIRPKDEIRQSLVGIDSELDKIMKTREPADVKIKRYQQTLDRYIQQRDQYYAPVEMKLKLDKPSEPTTDGAGGNAIVSAVKPKHRATAQLLFNHIDNNPRIGWNKNFELKIDNRRVAGSNLFNLVQDFVTPGVVGGEKPEGFQEFANVLKETNVPRAAVANYHRWRLIDSQQPGPPQAALPQQPPTVPPKTRGNQKKRLDQSGGKFKWLSFKV